LRQAQLGLLQGAEESSAPGFEHPYFWAPFFLIGDNGRL
jgi:CHAT domain-containing protein